MSEEQLIPQRPQFKDRKSWLVFFGIVHLIIAFFIFLLLLFLVIGFIASQFGPKEAQEAMPASAMVSSFVIYTFIALWFVTMGIGSILTLRWARALILASSWLWLVIGIAALVFVMFFLQTMGDQLVKDADASANVLLFVKFFVFGMIFFTYIVIPGSFILFYRSKNVKATCEWRDPYQRWTDQCHPSVLPLVLLFCSALPSIAVTIVYNSVVPFFGFIMSGFAGTIVILFIAGLLCYLAWGIYNQDLRAWWCSLVFGALGALSTIITFLRVDIFQFFERMNYPESQLEQMRQFTVIDSWMINVATILSYGAFVLYLFLIKKHFSPKNVQNSAV